MWLSWDFGVETSPPDSFVFKGTNLCSSVTEGRRGGQQLGRCPCADPTPGVHTALTAGGVGVGGVSR